MEVRVRLLKTCYAGLEGKEVDVTHQEFERLRLYGYAALIPYETAASVTPNRRRGRPKSKQ